MDVGLGRRRGGVNVKLWRRRGEAGEESFRPILISIVTDLADEDQLLVYLELASAKVTKNQVHILCVHNICVYCIVYV